MSPLLSSKHWGLHGGVKPDKCVGSLFDKKCWGVNPMSERNYPCDSIILVYFSANRTKGVDVDGVGEFNFKQQLYMCMIGQALSMKANIETRRSKNELGCLVWQYNEIWPTGGKNMLQSRQRLIPVEVFCIIY